MVVYAKPYLWRIPRNFPNNGYAMHDNFSRKTNSYIFMEGRRLPFDTGLPHWTAPAQHPSEYDLLLSYKYAEEKLLTYDCIPNNAHSPIVNRRVLGLLSALCPHDFQAFPVTIKSENPKIPDFENHDYHLINITQSVDAIDREKSVIKYYDDGEIDSLKVLYLKENAMCDHHLARIQDYTPKIVVSGELVKLFKKEKVKGVRFITDEELFRALWSRMPSAD